MRIRKRSVWGGVVRNFLKSSSLVALGVGCAMLMPVSPAQADCKATDTDQTCTNSTSLPGPQNGILDNGSLTVTNTASGTISGNNGINANNTANVTNFGTISGTAFGIDAETANVTNSGTISATGAFGTAIAATSLNITNSGTISATGTRGEAINAGVANVTNSGTISATGAGALGLVASIANVTNSGSISATGTNGLGIGVNTIATVFNSGTISASGTNSIGIAAVDGVANGTANVRNTGTISAVGTNSVGIGSDGTANVINSGIVLASGKGSFGISAGIANVTNSGTIQGATGILAFGSSTLVNSGSIIGTGGTAIDFSHSSTDTLTFLPGSRIVGAILLGGGDTVNVQTGRGISSMLTFTPNGPFSLAAGGSAPFVISGNSVATLDPTAFAQADRAMMDFTSGISSLVNSRFGGMAPVGASAGISSFAPAASGLADSASGAFASIPSLAIAYAPEAPGFVKAPSGNVGVTTVWSGAFGGIRDQRADGALLAATGRAVGAALGVDRRVAPDLWLGGFIGGGAGRLSVDLNSQTVNTDYLFAGGYGRYDWNSQFVEFMLYGGHTANTSNRTVANNLAPGGLENATSRYDGWFFSPDVTYGVHLPMAGYVLTPTARLRYVAGVLDGYSEVGSAQNLSVGSRTLQDLEQRLELDLSKTMMLGGDNTLKAGLHGGIIGLERVGDTNVNTVLLGQNLAFVTPGRSSAFGGLAGGSFDFSTSQHISLFGALDGIWMNDNSTTVTAKGGVRGTF
jgi:uncharacterized protein with beta-barrel porin domain